MRGPDRSKTARARRLRRDSTDAERKLWNRLRARSIGEAKFVRQEAIGPYVVDFVCRAQRLVIEVDGGQHATDKRDAARTAGLVARRYRVLRFWNNEVLGNIDGVLEVIAAELSRDETDQRRNADTLDTIATEPALPLPASELGLARVRHY